MTLFKKYKKMGFVREWHAKPVCGEPAVIFELTDTVGDMLVLFSDGRLVVKKEGSEAKKTQACLRGTYYRSAEESRRLLVDSFSSMSGFMGLLFEGVRAVSLSSMGSHLVLEHYHEVLIAMRKRRAKNKRLSDLYQVSFVTRQNYKRAVEVYTHFVDCFMEGSADAYKSLFASEIGFIKYAKKSCEKEVEIAAPVPLDSIVHPFAHFIPRDVLGDLRPAILAYGIIVDINQSWCVRVFEDVVIIGRGWCSKNVGHTIISVDAEYTKVLLLAKKGMAALVVSPCSLTPYETNQITLRFRDGIFFISYILLNNRGELIKTISIKEGNDGFRNI